MRLPIFASLAGLALAARAGRGVAPEDGEEGAKELTLRERMALNAQLTPLRLRMRAAGASPEQIQEAVRAHATQFASLASKERALKGDIFKWQMQHELRVRGLSLTEHMMPSVPQTETENQMRAAIKRSYWDLIQQRLADGWSDGSGFALILERLEELLILISKLVKDKDLTTMRAAVDLDSIRVLVAQRGYDLTAFCQTLRQLVDIYRDLETPYQHARTREFFCLDAVGAVLPDEDTAEGKKASEKAEKAAQASGGSVCLTQLEQGLTNQTYAGSIVSAMSYLFRKIDICKSDIFNYHLSRAGLEQKQTLERNSFFKTLLRNHGGHAWLEDTCLKRWNAGPRKVVDADSLYAQLVPAVLRQARPTDQDVPVPVRVELMSLCALQDAAQRLYLMYVIALTCSGLLAEARFKEHVGAFFVRLLATLSRPDVNKHILLEDVHASLSQVFSDEASRGLEQHPSKSSPQDAFESRLAYLVASVPEGRINASVKDLSVVLSKGEDAPILKVIHERMREALLSPRRKSGTASDVENEAKQIRDLPVPPLRAGLRSLQDAKPVTSDVNSEGINKVTRRFSRVTDASLGTSPWFLSFVSTELQKLEVDLETLCVDHWEIYSEYYLNPPVSARADARLSL